MIFQKELTLTKQWHQNNVMFVTIGNLKILVLSMNHILAMVVMSFNDFAIIYDKESAYRIHFWCMGKDDVISIMNNSNLVDKKGVFKFFFILYKNE